MILTLNLRANIILSHQFDVDWTLNIELCLLGQDQKGQAQDKPKIKKSCLLHP